MPNSATTVLNLLNAHTPCTPKHILIKGSGWGYEIFLWLIEQNESDIKFNFVLNSSAYMRTIKHGRNISTVYTNQESM